MATGPMPFKILSGGGGEDDDINLNRPHDYDELIATLPRSKLNFVLYQNFWWRERLLLGVIQIQQRFRPRPTDVFLATIPKSGSTWLRALTFTIMTRNQTPLAQNPILSHHPHDCVVFMDGIFAMGHGDKLESMPSPRILNTHMPYSTLPASVADCRIVYLCRDPKDIAVSMWKFLDKSQRPDVSKPFSFDEVCDMFCEGTSPYGPVWDHALEYRRESLRRPENVMFLKYEEMMEKTVVIVKRLAEFLGCPFSEEEEKEGVAEEVVRICSFESLKGLEVNKVGNQGIFQLYPNSAYFRKGGVGDWKNYMSPEMAEKIDGVMKEKLQGSGLVL